MSRHAAPSSLPFLPNRWRKLGEIGTSGESGTHAPPPRSRRPQQARTRQPLT